MIDKVRRQFEQVRDKKLHKFDDLDPLIRRCLREYSYLFPDLQINKGGGSKVVYHFNVQGLNPISIEKEHGSRDCIPRHFAKLIIEGLEDLIVFIESSISNETSGGERKEEADE